MILKDVSNDRIVHSSIKALVIDEGCGNEFRGDLLACGFGHPETLVVKENSLINLSLLRISDNGLLKSIETENGSVMDTMDSSDV